MVFRLCCILARRQSPGVRRTRRRDPFLGRVHGEAAWCVREPGRRTYLAYSPDGKTLVSIARSGSETECRWWDLATGKVLRRWADVRAPTALSPDGKILALGAEGSRLHLWNLATGKDCDGLPFPGEKGSSNPTRHCAAFSLDGKHLAVGDLTNRVHVWDVSTGSELYCSSPCSPPFQGSVMCLAFSPDGKTLAVGAWLRILLWEATTGKDLLPRRGTFQSSQSCRVFPDGNIIATEAEDAMILWDPLTGRECQRVSDSRQFLAFAPHGDLLLGNKGSIVQWHAATGQSLRTWKVYDREPRDGRVRLAVSLVGRQNNDFGQPGPDAPPVEPGNGGRVVAGAADEQGPTFSHGPGGTLAARIHPRRYGRGVSGRRLRGPFLGRHDGKGRWFPVEERDVVLSGDGRFLVALGKVTASTDGSVFSQAARHGYGIWRQDEIHARPSCTGSPLAPWPFLQMAALWRWRRRRTSFCLERVSRKEIRRLKGHHDHVLDLTFAPDGKMLVSGSYDLTALSWDVTGIMRDRRFPKMLLKPKELEAAWRSCPTRMRRKLIRPSGSS